MPIIPQVGRRGLSLRLVIWSVYTVLSVGAVTMVYPFALMVSTSFEDKLDRSSSEYRLVPRWVTSRRTRYQSFLLARHPGLDNLEQLNARHGTSYGEFSAIPLPDFSGNEGFVEQRVKDWHGFKASLPPDHLCYFGYVSTVPLEYQGWIKEKFETIEAYNEAYLEEKRNFKLVAIPVERYDSPLWKPDDSPKWRDWVAFKENLEPRHREPTRIDQIWREFLTQRYSTVERLNAAYGTQYASIADAMLPPCVPANTKQRADWEAFVRTQFPPRYVRFPGEADRETALEQWREGTVPVDEIELAHPEHLYREFLLKKYGSLEALNAAQGTDVAVVMQIRPPRMEEDWLEFDGWTWRDRLKAMFRNYGIAVNHLFYERRAFLNTAVLCIGTVLSALTVNPLCAYALSRFRLSYTNKVLLFCLATMAFPAEVTMIPNYLLMRDLHLLNTYFALILPGMANGFSIFILKGFFDSLPKELYEAAQLDGAGELTMFARITLPLSGPVMAVIGIGAFTLAYGSFMWAFIVCQDPDYWTVMVYVYQLQILMKHGDLMALLVLTALPTLLVFIFCQRIILRGIVVPTMH